MTRITKLLMVAAIALLSSIYASPQTQPSLALVELQAPGYGPQGGYGQGAQVITCSSNDGKRNYCAVDTRRGVRLSRQISGSPCTATVTWGYDPRGIWVDRGCRAEFVVGGRPLPPPQVITCSSNNGKRNYCPTNGLDLNTIVMTRQISGSVCRRGYSWGTDGGRGLWVDLGCRAEFRLNPIYR